jgi:predicted nucleic acid-binding Zn ribbon protein
MSDDFDRASDREMADRELSIAQARAKNQPLKAVTHCLFCNESILIGRYCSAECREDGEMEATIRGKQYR